MISKHLVWILAATSFPALAQDSVPVEHTTTAQVSDAAAQCSAIIRSGAPQMTAGRVASIYAVGKKGEYDTTAAYLARLRKLIGDGNIAASAPISYEYDADNGVLTVASSDFTTSTMDLDARASDILANYEFLALSDSTKLLGSFIGQNAFGVKRRVRSYVETQLGIAWKTELGKSLADPDPATIPVSPAQAKSMRGHLRVLIAGEFTSPYTFRGVGGCEATITNPTDQTVYKYAVAATPRCGVIYDGVTKQVYASWTIKPS